MEHPAGSSSSKVTVEYTDPSGVYPLISRDLYQRLPLRNLHWNSSSRPLRSIGSLHIELIPDLPSASHGSSALPSSADSAPTNDVGLVPHVAKASRSEARTNVVLEKERRHQIPGLRRTPYLKIYLLRCDDTETYKATSRKQLREWVKSHTPPSQSSISINKQENHDAFEWLIVHVVLLGDDAGSSRSSGTIKSDSRWPTRSSSSVIEKTRVDFNGTSKNAVDRVAQIQATESSAATEKLSRPTPYIDQQSRDDDRGWTDLIAKVKLLILASFDLRVSQYEEDIREKDSQRNLPGWNFNTFFVLKEGLARGFESVGLVEDALTGYHELAVGLNVIINGQETSNSTKQHTDPFRDHTEDVLEEFVQAVRSAEFASEGRGTGMSQASDVKPLKSTNQSDFGASILNTDRKPFRSLILANDVSAFDFQCYVFARQVSLLLRLANVVCPEQTSANGVAVNGTFHKHDAKSEAGSVPEDREPENLLILAEICRRAVEFITSGACALREDLKKCVEHDSLVSGRKEGLSETTRNNVIENLVTSWTFSTTQAILKATSVPSLSTQLQPLLRQLKPESQKIEDTHKEHIRIAGAVQRQNLPNRTSSLPSHASITTSSPSLAKFPSITSLDALRLLPPSSPHTGSQDLAAQRADILFLGRRALSSLGVRFGGWSSGWHDLTSAANFIDDEMEEVSLEGGAKNVPKSLEDSSPCTVSGIRNKDLLSAMSSRKAFYNAYEESTATALALYVLGGRSKSAEGMTADIATVRFRHGDYMGAASYLHPLAPFYAKDDWSHLENIVLKVYAECLKHLDRNAEYIQVTLDILAKIVRRNQVMLRFSPGLIVHPDHQSSLRSHLPGSSDYLKKLTAASKSLEQPVTVPMGKYFGNIHLEPFINLYESHDGFQLVLRFRHFMLESFIAHNVRVKIVTVREEQDYEIWLTAEGIQRIEPGFVKIIVGSNVIFPAWYKLEQIIVQSEKIVFSHNLAPPPGGPVLTDHRESGSFAPTDSTNQAQILVWSHPKALDAQLSHCRSIHLEKTRSIEIEISSGWNDVIEGTVLLRAATAGLRIHTSELDLISNNWGILDKSQPGIIRFGNLSAGQKVNLRIPYSLESDLKEIIVKIEVSFTTAKGIFTYACNPRTNILLPVGVNVQDIFTQDVLYSKFTISTADMIPLRVSRCSLQGTDDFTVSSPSLSDNKLDIFFRQPLSVLCSIYPAPQCDGEAGEDKKSQRGLFLGIEYCRLDQEVHTAVEDSLSNALKAGPFQELSRLLVPAFSDKVRSSLLSHDLEMIGILREINIGNFQDFGWDIILSGLNPQRRLELTDWLMSWHEKHTIISIPNDCEASRIQYLTVPVEVPHVDVVHTARLRLLDAEMEKQADSTVAAIGNALHAILTISHTRRWGTVGRSPINDEAMDFCYELQASPDTWLIGGQKKAHFSSKEYEMLSFSLMLLPQKTGHLLYPSIDIRSAQRHDDNDATSHERRSSIRPCSCEIDYCNRGETVLIIPDLSSTTVSLDPNGSTNGAWLIESTSRLGDR